MIMSTKKLEKIGFQVRTVNGIIKESMREYVINEKPCLLAGRSKIIKTDQN